MRTARSSQLLALLALLAVNSCDQPKSEVAVPPATTAALPPATTAALMLKNVDASRLTLPERREWEAHVTELLAPCPEVPVSLAQCITDDRVCKTCLPAAQLLLKQVQTGRSKREREEAFHARFDVSNLKAPATDGSPALGPSNAVVTIVEWADFECHSCRAVYPVLDELAHRYPTQVRVVFKFYPFAVHPHGEISARAAVAAFRQGKFLEMHHLLFDHNDKLEQSDLERYAKQLNLDVARFRKDLGSTEVGEFIERDKKQATELGISRTPFLFINGRPVNLRYVVGPADFLDWVKLDIELAGQVPNAVEPKDLAAAQPGASAGVPAAGNKR